MPAVATDRFDRVRSRVNDLKKNLKFRDARALLADAAAADLWNDESAWRRADAEARARSSRQFPWLIQQWAICTYKDEDLIPAIRFRDAISLLERVGLRDQEVVAAGRIDSGTLPETLALGGAIYKRRWLQEGQLEHLHQSLGFYLAAWKHNPKRDLGYGGANAACILDTLASRIAVLARRSGHAAAAAALAGESERLRREATELRRDMLAKLPGLAAERAAENPADDPRKQYWYLATLAEIHFGLEHYDAAREALTAARQVDDPGEALSHKWVGRSTFEQLLSLAKLHNIAPPDESRPLEEWHPAWRAIHALLGDAARPALSSYRGRVGLALSGGGLRASFFHIGVLARLADVDALRGVDVISTVSGGSIVGAHYYLLLADHLRKTPDGKITRQDYVTMVQTLRHQFEHGVRRNIRMRTLANLGANLRMIFSSTYSRSDRLGQLYDEELYAQVEDGQNRHRLMQQLIVKPAGYDGADFKPNNENWIRRAKVPNLLLNATSLNSGHSWQFTARSMGEPPGLVEGEVDGNGRYRRAWYDRSPTDELRNYQLGTAVAASSCVPGLFEPLVIDKLYPGRTVRLVDGGVHDNQGIAGLLNEGCTMILCSDASGQMSDVKRPGNSLWGVPLRCNSILMSRVRTAQYQDLRGRLDSRSLQGLMFLHLKKELESHPLDWNGGDKSPVAEATSATTSYRVDKELQEKLAKIRTDLDSFTEVEAAALMTSGYLMAEQQLKDLDERHGADGESGTWGDVDVKASRGPWPFLALEELMRKPPRDSDARRQELGRQLDVAQHLAFKIWRLDPRLRVTVLLLGFASIVALVAGVVLTWDASLGFSYSITVGGLVLAGLLLLAGFLVPAFQWLDPASATRGYLRKAALAVFGFIGSNLHLWTFDVLFRRHGRLKRLLTLP